MTLGIILAFGALAMGVAGLIVMRVARASSPTFPLVTRPMDNTGRDEVPAPIRPDLSAGQLVATLVATVYPEQVTTDIAGRQQRLELIQEASIALFGSEYISASQVAAWKQHYPELLHVVSDSSWLRQLPADRIGEIDRYRQPIHHVSAAVKEHNTRFLAM